VQTALDGLEEKFRVYNEDPLADALKERLDKLAKKEVKWTHEILHLLLELSNKPVTKSRLDDLDSLKEPELETGPPLRWDDLAAEDPLLRDRSLWKNVDFGAESSDEDGFEDSRSELSGVTDTTGQSSIDEELYRRLDECVVQTADKEALEKLREAQFWKKIPNINGVKLETVKKPITELQAVRETLFMLSGFPTSLFKVDEGTASTIIPSTSYILSHASNDAFMKLIEGLALQGSAVMSLRLWTKQPQSIALLQALQSQIETRILDLDAFLSGIQQRFVAPNRDVVISLLSVQTELSQFLRPLIRLSGCVKRMDTERYAGAFWYLEMLYDETCTSQMAGDDEMYSYMGRLFFDCFRVYLRPMRTWMENGELSKGDKVFFVSEVAGEIDLTSLWQSRFKIRKTPTGALHAPKFLHAAANKIFTAGKSIVVLKQLNQFQSLQALQTTLEPNLDFETVCNPLFLQLAPFPELFDAAFEDWIQSKYRHASSVLRKSLFDSCGLHTSLEILSHLYLLTDGTAGAAFTNAVFDKLDTLKPSWNDRFTLTELARTAFSFRTSVASDRLRAIGLSLPRKFQDVSVCRRSVKVFRAVRLDYRLSWPIQIIVTPASVLSYQAIFTFLFQVRRSSHILSRQGLKTDNANKTNGTDERALYYSLRSRLLWFTHTLYHYLTSLVIEPGSQTMRNKLREAEDVDSMISVHEQFIKSTKDQALLGSRLELIHKTILKILDLSIKLEDAQAANALITKETEEQQKEMMNMSMASLGLHTSHRKTTNLASKITESDSSEDDEIVDVDLSILSSTYENDEDGLYLEKLRKMRADFDRLVRFVASGLKGVARAASGEEGKSWDILGEMLETGLGAGQTAYR
jgi:gamma-tubulin complex component 5